MENQQTTNNISNLSKGLMIAFAIALLVSVYFLFTLPSDLRFKGNLSNTEFLAPVLIKLYLSLAITAALAIVALYAEMKKVRVAIVYKEKTSAQIKEEEKAQAESTNLEGLSGKLISGTSSTELITNALNTLAKKIDGVAGACYLVKEENTTQFAELINGFALPLSESDTIRFNFGDGMVGQVAKSGNSIFIDDIPDGYFQVISGLGQASPKFILILPIKKANEVKGVLEIATFKNINKSVRDAAEQFAKEVGEKLS